MLVLAGTRDERLAVGRELGADVVNVHRDSDMRALRDSLGSGGAQVVIECAGTPGALALALDLAGWRARIAVEGVQEMDALLPLPAYKVMQLAIRIQGISGWSTSNFKEALALLANGRVNVKPLLTHQFPLESWQDAFKMITERKSEAIKVQFVL
jgi:L-iditol 2-dehydrogenase